MKTKLFRLQTRAKNLPFINLAEFLCCLDEIKRLDDGGVFGVKPLFGMQIEFGGRYLELYKNLYSARKKTT